MNPVISLHEAVSGSDFVVAGSLFRQYAEQLDFSLCFQDFEAELEGIRERYGAPDGTILIAWSGETPIGCVALKRLDVGICEMKRLFIHQEWRGKGIGRMLVEALIQASVRLGYLKMRLDTIRGKMDVAISLYQSVGFKEIPAYYENPLEGAYYMELDLKV